MKELGKMTMQLTGFVCTKMRKFQKISLFGSLLGSRDECDKSDFVRLRSSNFMFGDPAMYVTGWILYISCLRLFQSGRAMYATGQIL